MDRGARFFVTFFARAKKVEMKRRAGGAALE